MAGTLNHLEPKAVWSVFDDITQYPRPSKKEEKIVAYVENFAKNLGFELKKDKIGNILIKKPATAGMENRKSFSIQAHLDMVCEKNRGVEFDFDNDAIQTWIDGDWVKAKGTTLGADNGIGLAMGMAVLASTDIKHPAFELLCTLDEETGLTGAIQLGTDLLSSEILINLDSEEDGHFTIGCAGGINTIGKYKYIADSIPDNTTFYEIGIKGLRGGHSGIEIHDGRGCSLKLISRLLWNLNNKFNIRLSSIEGGNKHNAIPREAFAVIGVNSKKLNDFEAFYSDFTNSIQKEYATKEPNLAFTIEKVETPSRVMAEGMQDGLINSFYAMPHGVIRFSPDIAGLVQTSTNFAVCRTNDSEVEVLTSQRSLAESEKKDIFNMVQSVHLLGGATVVSSDGYPAWEPNINSPILKTATEIYKNVFGKDAVIETIHAGLECGLVGDKYPGMDMLSFGPNLKEVHTPDEMVQISSVQNCWKLLVHIIENLPLKD
jgi:dipeptidase D